MKFLGGCGVFLVLALVLGNDDSNGLVRAQPPNGGGGPPGGGMMMAPPPGAVASTRCAIADGTSCNKDGTSNEVFRSLQYSTTTGRFSGSMVTNLCSNNLWGRNSTGVFIGNSHTSTCYNVSFPTTNYSGNGPFAAPLRGPVALSLFGVSMYGPYEAGFTLGQACNNNLGTCPAGIDLDLCEKKLEYECGINNVQRGMLMDSCGGHANPYHIHTRMSCDEANNGASNVTTQGRAPAGHSPLVGIALDGRGVYGQSESSSGAPTDLDACGGHYGYVPAISMNGLTGHNDTLVYHYHTQSRTPFILGCFGPATVSQCKTLYPTCGTGYVNVTTASGTVSYDTDCPCHNQTEAIGVLLQGPINSTAVSVTATNTTTPLTTVPAVTPKASSVGYVSSVVVAVAIASIVVM